MFQRGQGRDRIHTAQAEGRGTASPPRPRPPVPVGEEDDDDEQQKELNTIKNVAPTITTVKSRPRLSSAAATTTTTAVAVNTKKKNSNRNKNKSNYSAATNDTCSNAASAAVSSSALATQHASPSSAHHSASTLCGIIPCVHSLRLVAWSSPESRSAKRRRDMNEMFSMLAYYDGGDGDFGFGGYDYPSSDDDEEYDDYGNYIGAAGRRGRGRGKNELDAKTSDNNNGGFLTFNKAIWQCLDLCRSSVKNNAAAATAPSASTKQSTKTRQKPNTKNTPANQQPVPAAGALAVLSIEFQEGDFERMVFPPSEPICGRLARDYGAAFATSLQELNIFLSTSRESNKDLAALAVFRRLERLSFNSCSLASLLGLRKGFPLLRDIDITGCSPIESFEEVLLDGLPMLKTVNAIGTMIPRSDFELKNGVPKKKGLKYFTGNGYDSGDDYGEY